MIQVFILVVVDAICLVGIDAKLIKVSYFGALGTASPSVQGVFVVSSCHFVRCRASK